MKQISKVDQRLQRTGYGKGAPLLGLPFVGFGGWLALAGFGLIPLPGKANAPLWVIGWCGVSLALVGLLLGAQGLRGILSRRVGRSRAWRHPNRPWYADYPWKPRSIRDAPGARALRAGFVALLGDYRQLPGDAARLQRE